MKPNVFPAIPGRCTANHRWPKDVGTWRPCHAPFEVMGGPIAVGSAQLCKPCHDKLFAPALALQKQVNDTLHRLLEGGKR